MALTSVETHFDCGHVHTIRVDIDPDVTVPESVRGLGQCPDCMGEENVVPVSGVAPQPGGAGPVLDSILMIPI
jgi:hypothetical protein